MAGYDIFTNIQGPAVPVSLYGDAATAGINAGNALPTHLTAGIQGAIKGIQQGQEIVANQQQNQIRANQIERLPVANQVQDAQLKSIQNSNRINEVRANIAAQTEVAATEETLAQLNYQKQKYEEASQAATALAAYSTEAGELDPVTFKNNVLSGKYDAVFSSNPKAYEKALKDLYINQQKNGLAQDPITLGAIGTMLKRSNAVSSIDKLAEQKRLEAEANERVVLSDSLTDDLSRKLEGDPRNFPNRVRVEQQGKYLLDPNTHAILRSNSGQFIENTPANREFYKIKQDQYDPKSQSFLAFDPNTGEILVDNVSPDSKKNYNAAVKFGKLMSGETARATADSIGNDFREEINRARNQATPPAQGPGYDAVAQKTLGIGPDTVAAIQPSLKALDKEASIYASSPESRNSPGALSSRAAVVTNTAKAIAKHNFETNPDLKNTYNENAVFKWNKDIDDQIAALENPGFWSFLGKINSFNSPGVMAAQNMTVDTLKSQKAADPLELYYIRQSAPLEKSVNDLFDKLAEARSLQADRVTNNIKASAATASYLASIPRR